MGGEEEGEGVEREGSGEGWEGNRIEGKGREWKGREGRKRGRERDGRSWGRAPQNFWARTATEWEPKKVKNVASQLPDFVNRILIEIIFSSVAAL
jgi:hypothetical protein